MLILDYFNIHFQTTDTLVMLAPWNKCRNQFVWVYYSLNIWPCGKAAIAKWMWLLQKSGLVTFVTLKVSFTSQWEDLLLSTALLSSGSMMCLYTQTSTLFHNVIIFWRWVVIWVRELMISFPWDMTLWPWDHFFSEMSPEGLRGLFSHGWTTTFCKQLC